MRALKALVGALLFYPLLLPAQDPGKMVRLADRSDWWSILNENFYWPVEQPAGEELSAESFEIADFTIPDDPSFRSIKEKFGQAITATRGDASSGRHQVCYVSEHNPPMHLIFEEGESSLSFYLFSEGPSWNGDALCVTSPRVTSALRTKNGLALGISVDEVRRILGKPDFSSANRLAFHRELKKATADAKLADLRKEHAEMSDEEFHESYDSYELETYIEARFTDGKLTYLAVSKAENY